MGNGGELRKGLTRCRTVGPRGVCQWGLPHTVRFHELRYTGATLLCSKNVNPKVVQEMLGHANISTTIRKYKTISPAVSSSANRERHAAARVD